MSSTRSWLALAMLSAFAVPAGAQTFRVQCPGSTTMHPRVTTATRASRHQVPADLRWRRLRHHGRRHADLPVRLRPAVRPAGHLPRSAGHADRSACSTPSDRRASARRAPWWACPTASFTFNGAIGLLADPSIADDPACAATPRPSLLHHRTRRPRRSAPDHGRRRDERQRAGAADGDRRGRRVLPDADQRRPDHAARPVRAAHGALPRLPERLRVLRRRAGCLGRHQHRRQLHLLLPRARTPAPTSGTATSRRRSICRWAWSGSCTCGRGRTG